MPDELTMPEKLRLNADLVASTMREKLGVDLAFDRAGVEWVDGYIDRLGESYPAEKRRGLVDRLACFAGECIIRTCGGEWVQKEGWWGVQVSERLWACPFTKIDKQFENGAEDSVASFFTSIPVLDRHLEKGAG